MGVISKYIETLSQQLPSQMQITVKTGSSKILISNDFDECTESWIRKFELRFYYKKEVRCILINPEEDQKSKRYIQVWHGCPVEEIVKFIVDQYEKDRMIDVGNRFLKFISEPFKDIAKIQYKSLTAVINAYGLDSINLQIIKDSVKISRAWNKMLEIPISTPDCNKIVHEEIVKQMLISTICAITDMRGNVSQEIINKLLPIMGEINNRKGAYVESKRIFENALKIKVIQPNNDI